jgi:osmoprotectant transport system ATP-binding protein
VSVPAPNTAPAIELQAVGKRYGDQQNTHWAVRDLSLSIGAGELVALIGPSGCGKTTTLRMMNRLIEPSEGHILIAGSDSRSLRPHELRRRIGYAIQGVGLFPHLSVAENIAVVPKLLGWPAARIAARVAELLAQVGLEPARFGPQWPRQLSGGQSQRVGVARALAADPPMLLMDEPFGAVDPLTRERLQDEFLRLQKTLAKTVVIVTHDMDEAIKLSDRIAIMRDGVLEQFATPEHILEQPANGFVRDFVGADRGLKRLARVPVAELMLAAPETLSEHASLAEVRAFLRLQDLYSVFATDEAGVLVGWFTQAGLMRLPWRKIAVHEHASVREALALMLAESFQVLAVVNSQGQVVGEMCFSVFSQYLERPRAARRPDL